MSSATILLGTLKVSQLILGLNLSIVIKYRQTFSAVYDDDCCFGLHSTDSCHSNKLHRNLRYHMEGLENWVDLS